MIFNDDTFLGISEIDERFNADGVASVSWCYPQNGTYAFCALVFNGQKIVSSPVMLTVDLKTKATVNVEAKGDSKYTAFGRLLCDRNAVANKQIVVRINGTDVCAVKTNTDGSFSFLITLPPVNYNLTGYQIELVYHGSNSLDLRGLAKTPDDTEYAVCTTIQYGFKPASKSI